jgi:hypothetical protein
VSVTSRTLSRCLSAPCHLDNSTRTAPERDSHARLGFTLGVLSEIEFALRRINNLRGTFCLLNVCKLAPFFWGPPESLEMDKIGKTAPCGSPASGDRWSLYISLMTFIGISPVGALESSPWRKPWGQKRTARSPIGAKEPFAASDRSPGTKRFLTPLRGWRVSGPVPQGLRPGLLSIAPDGALDRADTRLTRRDKLGNEARMRAENVETQGITCIR